MNGREMDSSGARMKYSRNRKVAGNREAGQEVKIGVRTGE